MQTKSGVKDSIAQHWIDQLIVKSRLMHEERITNSVTQDPRFKDRKLTGDARQAVRKEIETVIETDLLQWLKKQPPHRYAALSEDSGMCTA